MSAATMPSSRRTPGPITTGRSCCAKAVDRLLPTQATRRMGPGFRRDDAENGLAAAGMALARDLLDAGDQLIDGLVHRHLFAHHAVHRLGPDVLVIQDGELVILGEVERRRAARELSVDRLAMTVSLPERALLSSRGDREPAPERTFDVRLEVFLLQ